MRRAAGGVVLGLVLGCGGCVAPGTREPANLYPLKQEIRAYVDSGRYGDDIARVARSARDWLEERVARRGQGERLAVVLDLDETLLLNWPHMSAMDFGYVPDAWTAWVDKAEAPPIEPVRDFYAAARQAGVEVFFITGRRERDRRGTEKNLRAVGCAEYGALICRPDEVKGPTATFKTAARERLVKEGWVIVANVGDQASDLAGGFAERTFKLPNPFYVTD